MMNPLLSGDEKELHVLHDEVWFGIYEVDSFKGKYLQVMTLLNAAVLSLEAPSSNRHRLAFVGVTKAAAMFKSKLARHSNEERPLVTQDGDDEESNADDVEQKGSLTRWYSALDEESSAPVVTDNEHGTDFEHEFRQEVIRIDEVSKEFLSQSVGMYHMLLSTLENHQSVQMTSVQSNSFRVEFKDIYQRLHHVSQYVNANHTMATRLLHTKIVADSKYGPRVRMELHDFAKEKFSKHQHDTEKFLRQVEELFGSYFGVGDPDVAHFELLSYVAGKKHHTLDTPVAVLLGFVLSSSMFSLAFVFFSPRGRRALEEEGLDLMYRGLSVISMLPWLNLIVIYVLRQYRINFVLLFQMDAKTRQYHGIRRLAVRACISTLLLLASLLTCLTCLYFDYRTMASACPAILFPFYLTGLYVSPWMDQFVHDKGRTDIFLDLIGLGIVTFPVVFRSDILTSLAKAIGDCARIICHTVYYTEWGSNTPPEQRTCATSYSLNHIIIPSLAAYPLWLRLIQNLQVSFRKRTAWPWFYNAIKYAFALEVVLLSSLKNPPVSSSVFLFIFTTSSLITFAWDVFMDFGLGQPSYYGLRERLMYPSKVFYYVVIALDLVLRFAWTLTLVSSGYVGPFSHAPVIIIPLGPDAPSSGMELFRRTMWGLLRVENEHLNNTLHYREVDYVPLYFYEDFEEQESEDDKKYQERLARDRSSYLLAFGRVALLLTVVVVVATWTLKE